MTYYKPLDALRCFAVLAVLAEHWMHGSCFVNLVSPGAIGVDIFFVLSGFLITGILLRYRERDILQEKGHRKSIKTFFMRRILRIFPLYYLTVIVSTVFNQGVIREAFPWNMTYTTNFFLMQHGNWFGLFGHWWSLAVEEQFYLLWPFLVLFFKRRWLLPTFAILFVLALVSRFLLYDWSGNYVTSTANTLGCFDCFAVGGLLAFLHHFKPKMKSKILRMWWVPLILVGGLITLKSGMLDINYIWTPTLFRGFNAAIAFWIVGWLAFAELKFSRGFFEWKPFIFLGQISYGMYLLHNIVPGLLLGLKTEILALNLLLYFTTLVLLCWLLNRFFEKPILRLKRKFVRN